MKVRVKRLGEQTDNPFGAGNAHTGSNKTSGSRTLKAVPREQANVEVEKGETIVTDTTGDGIPEMFGAGGQRHGNGGTPLNLADESFVFSDTRSMKIKDKGILKEFGMSKSSTPAKIAKKYNLSKYKQVLLDPMSDDREIATAEKMISNYNIKLGKLALVQESMKGFEDGIPKIAFPYLMAAELSPEQILPQQAPQAKAPQQGMPMAQKGLQVKSNPGRLINSLMRMAQMRGGYGQKYNPYVYPKSGGYTNMKEQDYTTGANSDVNTNPPKSRVRIKSAPTSDNVKSKNDPTLKIGDYIKDADGNVKVWKGQSSTRQTIDDYRSGKAYEDLKSDFSKLSKDDRAALADRIRTGITSSNSKGIKNADPAVVNGMVELSDDELIDKMLKYQETVYKNLDEGEAGDIRAGKYSDKDRGSKAFDPDIAIFQSGYKALRELQSEGIEGFQRFDVEPLGSVTDPAQNLSNSQKQNAKPVNSKDLNPGDIVKREDGTYGVYNEGVSQVDGWEGDTTIHQALGTPKLVDNYGDMPKLEDEVVEDYRPELEVANYPEIPAMPWKQDLLRMQNAAMNKASLKKYLPWTAPVSLDTADPTFLDDSRAIQRVMGAANTSAQGLGPGSMAQRMALQAQAAGQAADITGQYDNQNVQIANQFASQANAIENQEAQLNNQKAEKLFDEWTVANQAYDNEQRAARTAQIQAYSDTITNMWETDSFNKMFPQYAVNPIVGGQTYFTQGNNINPIPEGPSRGELANRAIAEMRAAGISPEQIPDMMKYYFPA